jgi:hypothetical protein
MHMTQTQIPSNAENHTPAPQPYPTVALVEWAFQQGRAVGNRGDTTAQGLMRFGLACAATPTDALNVKNWLNGYAYGETERTNNQSQLKHPGYQHAGLR